jgi:PTH1 family peptidyl-tRNA hydrolase
MKLIVGLGNPWKEYEKTRHNAGFLLIDALFPGLIWHKKFDGEYAETIIDTQKILLLKPQTYMNKSWWSVAPLMNFFKITPKNLLVLHDEIDFPSAKIQLKFWWSPAGHNWLKDIIAKIWTQDFWRLRIGVDRPENPKHSVADYVLSWFKEWSLIEEKIPEIEKSIEKFLSE